MTKEINLCVFGDHREERDMCIHKEFSATWNLKSIRAQGKRWEE
jgi:hypothetical protein